MCYWREFLLSRRLDVLRTEWPARRPVAGWRVAVARDRAFFRAAKCEVATESACSTHGRAPPGPPWERLNIPITPCEVLAISSPPIRSRLVLDRMFAGDCPPFPRQTWRFIERIASAAQTGQSRSRPVKESKPAAARGLDDGSELLASIPRRRTALQGRPLRVRFAEDFRLRAGLEGGNGLLGVRNAFARVVHGKGDLERARLARLERRHASLALFK